MEELEFGKALTVFHSVGQLRELLKNYPDRTPVTICGAPGLFYEDENTHSLLLETMDSGGYEAISERMEATGDQEYMDF
jgi:hypothetical protein